jgi:hypothetical protein
VLTTDGATLLWGLAIGGQDRVDVLAVIGPAGEEATEVADVRVQDGVLTLTADFPADAANFEWVAREVRSQNGVVVDRQAEDGGRKPPGAVWTLEVELELAGVNP